MSTKSIYIVPLLRSLCQLSVNFRTDFKICLLTYKTSKHRKKHIVYLQIRLATSIWFHWLRAHKGITLSVPDICERKLKFLSKITPRLQADFPPLSFNTQNLYRKHRKTFAPLPFIPNEEEFSFIWLQFQFILSTSMTGQKPSMIVDHSVLQQSCLMKRKYTAAYQQHRDDER